MQPNLKFDHAFAIVRLDTGHDPSMTWGDILTDEQSYSHLVTIKEVVWDAGVAEAEVKRLNQLNSAKGSVYFFQVTRIQRRDNGTVS